MDHNCVKYINMAAAQQNADAAAMFILKMTIMEL